MKNLLLLFLTIGFLPAVFATEPVVLPPNAPTITGSNVYFLGSPANTLTASGCATGEVVDWYIGSATAIAFTGSLYSITPSTSTSYTAKCKDNLGVSSPSSAAFLVNVPIVNTPNPITASITSAVASGTAVTLTASGCTGVGETYQWENLSTAAVRSVSPTALSTYSVKCKSGTCFSTSIISYTLLNVGTKARYRAKSVSLVPGFLADTGTVFLAETGGCIP